MAKSILEEAVAPIKLSFTVQHLWHEISLLAAFFTFASEKVQIHYSQERKIHYLCLGADCPACAAASRVTEFTLLPFWNLKSRAIEILKLQQTKDGPRDRVVDFLLDNQKDLSKVVALINGSKDGLVKITKGYPRPETDRGVEKCHEFGERLEKGEIVLKDAFVKLSEDEIKDLPDVRDLVFETVKPVNDMDLIQFSPPEESGPTQGAEAGSP